jgi:hypothetical protein
MLSNAEQQGVSVSAGYRKRLASKDTATNVDRLKQIEENGQDTWPPQPLRLPSQPSQPHPPRRSPAFCAHDSRPRAAARERRGARGRLYFCRRGARAHAYTQISQSFTPTKSTLIIPVQHMTYLCKLSGRGYLCSLSGQNGHTYPGD